MSVALQHACCTTAEYLDMEAESSVKHEYLAGEVYAMPGASERHNRIALNVAYRFRTAARGGPCGVYISDMKLRIQTQSSFYYPDVMLTCQADDDPPLYKTAPCIVVEVLSPSTAAIDRREKWPGVCRTLVVDSENLPQRGHFLPDSLPHGCSMGQEAGEKWAAAAGLQPTIPKTDRLLAYRNIASLTAYLLIDAEQRRVEFFQRDEAGAWRQGVLEAEEILQLNCGALTIPLSLDDLYEDVRFAG